MKHLVCQLIILLKGCIVLSLEASVSPNPFLRPGSQQKPPPPAVKKFTPKPIPQKDMSKEIEFRGYFILKGKPYFCLFNKKSNHAEWISLSENTYEEFQASEFNMESEVLTVIYEGSSYDISLLQGGSSIGSSKQNSTANRPSNSRNLNSGSSGGQRYMPPRPKTAPQLPDWLVSKKNSSFPSSSTSSSGTRVGSLGSVPRRVIPGLPMPSSQSRTTDSGPRSNLNSGINNSRNTIAQKINRTTERISASDSSENTSFNNIVDDAVTPTTESTTFDLEGLPPPPPPPNITPPSPPPNILPSREN